MQVDLDGLNAKPDPLLFVASTGVKFRLNRVSRFILQEASTKLGPPPKPPKVYMEEKSRMEENPNDPDFIEASNKFMMEAGLLSIKVYFVLGTEPIEIPEGMLGPNDEWTEPYEFLGLDIPPVTQKLNRYLAWLKFYALSEDDQTDLIGACARASSRTAEADVARAMESFRDNKARNTADGVPATPED